jgi:hypothetical protein
MRVYASRFVKVVVLLVRVLLLRLSNNIESEYVKKAAFGWPF